MSKTLELIALAKDEVLRIEARSEEALNIIESIVYKNKPTADDIIKLQRVAVLLRK